MLPAFAYFLHAKIAQTAVIIYFFINTGGQHINHSLPGVVRMVIVATFKP
jgi:hypothetical protein